ncbi:unnamed protein product [Arctogadus glacialis]
MPTSVLDEILKEVVLQEGDNVYLTLALVCTTFRDIVSTNYLRRRAHFQWLDSFLQRTKKLSAPCTPLTPALDVDDYIKTAHQDMLGQEKGER